ncbi:hypothetical protein [Polymorphobacter sp.]|uniref:hypothetical protein n=1 Tax=Polymorphobacter sp. TaxID=1909290 RepID=UPI003F6E7B51
MKIALATNSRSARNGREGTRAPKGVRVFSCRVLQRLTQGHIICRRMAEFLTMAFHARKANKHSEIYRLFLFAPPAMGGTLNLATRHQDIRFVMNLLASWQESSRGIWIHEDFLERA